MHGRTCFPDGIPLCLYIEHLSEARNDTVEHDLGFIYKIVYKASALTGFVLPYSGINNGGVMLRVFSIICSDLFYL